MSVLTRIAFDWALRCFGRNHVTNHKVRSLRLVEEAIELCQAVGLPQHKVEQCVKTVYSRPVGNAAQEIGGVCMTLAVLCESMGYDQDELMERELRRVLEKPTEHFAKRNTEKDDLGLSA